MAEATFRAADLDRDAAAGLIGAEEAERLKAFLAESTPAAPEGEEELRFIRNFHDVFLAMGIVIFSIGLATAVSSWVPYNLKWAALLAAAGIL
jgi:cytochrome c-type biogenesis protein CcmH/NrfG